ncbi:MAG: hypothetical protein COT74_09080 [Bdellovibrionales bacterium CG10_big_fil_rev_8_21_14_0_10_45_34]|nr:MAG: hypothetical protein COT74_09080 [Bdellovibrionales bacterium CG10_big_fil_rev_8_21_14_0_10_45_34]
MKSKSKNKGLDGKQLTKKNRPQVRPVESEMKNLSYKIILEKETFKFSCSHFTILAPNKAERLHGHNYYLSCEIGVNSVDKDLGFAFDLNTIKPILKQICDELDERIVIAGDSPYLKIKRSKIEVELRFASRRYVFPRNETVVLEISNVTVEELSRWILEKLMKKIKKQSITPKISWIAIGLEESRGQKVIAKLALSHK